MRKKISRGKAAPVRKFAEGGNVGGRRISQGLRSDRASQPRIQEAERAMDAVSGVTPERTMPMAAADSLPIPPIPPRRRRGGRGMSEADALNEREMTRILNDRSLESARAGRSMYRKGGAVKGKK